MFGVEAIVEVIIGDKVSVEMPSVVIACVGKRQINVGVSVKVAVAGVGVTVNGGVEVNTWLVTGTGDTGIGAVEGIKF